MRNVAMNYVLNTETCTVTLTTSGDNGIPTGQVVTWTNTGTSVVIGTATYPAQKITYGINYRVSVNDKAGYITPDPVTFTAGQATRAATLDYAKIVVLNLAFTISTLSAGWTYQFPVIRTHLIM
ncbi:hypothetical protein Barb6XT_00476 [Bacteroidales bacterium Barb6XT]|nr:hypothetical protein Barb6XT_00476 [Bacteroidales bacterium Barb6XT]